MKLRRLTLNIAGVITAFSLFGVIACNNNDKSANNSTTENLTDTMSTNTGTTTTGTDTSGSVKRPPGKRTGKVTIKPVAIDKTTAMKTDDKGYYNYSETAPAYPGGLESYIVNNIQYPEDAVDNGVEGTVFVTFTIDENGKVGNAKTTGTAFGYGMEDEAIRVVNAMSAWTPGMNKGKKVKAWYTLPITYKLEE